MKESVKNKKKTNSEAKTSSEKKTNTHAYMENSSNSDSSSTILSIMLVLLIVQLILSIVIIIGMSNTPTNNVDTGNLDVTQIEEKITRIDDFFAANFDGYLDGAKIEQPTGTAQPSNVGEVDTSNEPMIGNADAPITIVEFSDFECPFCGRFFDQTYPELKEKYIDTGKAKLVFKDFPLSFHPMAKPSAIAATCVFELEGDDAFFEMHDMIFQGQASLSDSKLKDWALEVGVDEAEYDSCITDSKIADEVDADFNEGAALGVSGTPSFIINGKLLVGAQPFSEFEKIIEAELNN